MRNRRATQETLLDVWPDIGDDKLDLIMDICERSPEDWGQRQLLADDEASRKRFRDAIVERGALAGLSSLLAPEELQQLMSAPIEDWMIFLHPDQRALVGDAGGRDQRDALFIVGDGAQKIYPGGFTLAQAGVDVRGNSAVLRVNYRNTRQIMVSLCCTTTSRATC